MHKSGDLLRFAAFSRKWEALIKSAIADSEKFSLDESSESGGILYVFPTFGTARIVEKSRCSAEGDLFRASLEEAVFLPAEIRLRQS